jgi:hypothetical protein
MVQVFDNIFYINYTIDLCLITSHVDKTNLRYQRGTRKSKVEGLKIQCPDEKG